MSVVDLIEREVGSTPAPVAHAQALRKFVGEALREPIRWDQHPAWTIHALRATDPRTPPPLFTAEDIARTFLQRGRPAE